MTPPNAGALTTTASEMEVHPAAAIFPMLDQEALAELAKDIADNGLIEPIVLRQGVLVDGRNRLAACQLAGVDPEFREWEGDEGDLVSWIVSKNIHRRHLTTSQRAAIAASLATLPAHRPEVGKFAGIPTQAQAAKLLGVSERSVRTARTVIESGDEQLIDQVRQGEVSVSAAAASLQPQPDRPAIKLPPLADRVALTAHSLHLLGGTSSINDLRAHAWPDGIDEDKWRATLAEGKRLGLWGHEGVIDLGRVTGPIWRRKETPAPGDPDAAWLQRAVLALLRVLALCPDPSMDALVAWKAVEAELGGDSILGADWAHVWSQAERDGLAQRQGEAIWLLEPGAQLLALRYSDDPAMQGFLARLEEDPDEDEDTDDDCDDDTGDEETGDEDRAADDGQDDCDDTDTDGDGDRDLKPAPRGEAELLKEALDGASVGRKDGLVPMVAAREAFAYLVTNKLDGTVPDEQWTRAVRLGQEAQLVHRVGASLRLAPEQSSAQSGLSNGQRAALDAYWTPLLHARALVRWLDERVMLGRGAPEVVLEPSVGGGAWLRAARDQWEGARLRAFDIDPGAPGLELAEERQVGDFMSTDLARCDLVLGNPPYREDLPAWVDRSRALAPVVAYLMRGSWIGSVKRQAWFKASPPEWIVVVGPRPKWEGPGASVQTDMIDPLLFVWTPGYQGAPKVDWLDVRETP